MGAPQIKVIFTVLVLLLSFLGFNFTWAQEKEAEEQIQWLIGKMKEPEPQLFEFLSQEIERFGENAVPYLIKALKNPNEDIRANIACLLKKKVFGSNNEVTPALLTALTEEKESYPKVCIIQTLTNLKASGAAEVFINILPTESTYVQETLVWALGILKDPRAPKALISFFKETKDPVLRTSCLNTLGNYKEPQLIDEIIKSLKDDDNPQIIIAGISALNNISIENGVFEEETIEILSEWLIESPFLPVRQEAFSVLAPRLTIERANILIGVLSDPDPKLREQAFETLKRLTLLSFNYNPQANPLDRDESIQAWKEWWDIQASIWNITSETPSVSKEAYEYLIKAGKDSIPYLLESYSLASSEKEKASIMSVLEKLDIPMFLPEWKDAISEGRANDVRESALRILYNGLQSKEVKPENKEKGIGILKDIVKKDTERIHLVAAFYLDNLGDPDGIKVIAEALKDSNQKLNVIDIISQNQKDFSVSLIAPLTQLLCEDKEISGKILPLLKNRGGVDVYRAMIQVLPRVSEEVKKDIVAYLDKETLKDVAKDLIDVVSKEENPEIRVALIKLIQKTGVKGLGNEAYQNLLNDKVSEVRSAAALAVGSLEGKDALSILEKALGNEKNIQVQDTLISELTKIDKDKTISLVQSLSQSESQDVRKELAKRLVKLDSEKAISFLSEAISKEKESQVKITWIKELSKLTPLKVASIFKDCLEKDENPETRIAATEALVNLGPTLGAKSLREALSRETVPSVLATISFGLGKLQDTQSLQPLLETLKKHKESEVEIALLYAITTINPGEGLGLLKSVLTDKDKDTSVKVAAVGFMSNYSYAQVESPLKTALKDSSPKIRVEAINSLGKMKIHDTASEIYALIEDSESIVRAAASTALVTLTGIDPKYNPDSTPEERKNAQKLWQDWIETREKVRGLFATLEKEGKEEAKAEIIKIGKSASPTLNEIINVQSLYKERALALQLLSEIKDTDSIQKWAVDPDPAIRQDVYRLLYRLAPDEAKKIEVSKILAFLFTKERDLSCRITLLAIFSEAGESIYDAMLYEYLSGSYDEQRIVIETIADFGLSKFSPGIRDILSKLPDDSVMVAAINALGKLTDKRNIEPMIKLLDSSKTEIAQAAIKALPLNPGTPKPFPDTKEKVLEWWAKEGPALKQGIEIEDLIKSLIGEETIEYRFAKSRLMAINAREKIIPELAKVFEDPNCTLEIKLRLADILAEMADPSTVELLSKEINTESIDLLRKIAIGLRNIGSEKSAQILKTLVSNKDRWVRLTTLMGIGWAGLKETPDFFVKFLSDEEPKVREEALYWLSLQEVKDTSPIISALKSEDFGVRIAAARAVKRLGEKEASGELVQLLTDPSSEVREVSYDALKHLSGEKFPFEPRIDIKDSQKDIAKWKEWWEVRETGQKVQKFLSMFATPEIDPEKVKEEIVKSGPAAAVSLIKALSNPNRIIRKEIPSTLVMLVNKNAILPLIDQLKQEFDLEIRQIIITELKKLVESSVPLTLPPDTEESWKKEVENFKKEIWSKNFKTYEEEKAKAQESVKASILKLSEPNVNVEEIVSQLVKSGPAAVPILTEALKEKNLLVQKAICKVLAKTGKIDTAIYLFPLLAEQDSDLRQAAKEAIETLTGDKKDIQAKDEDAYKAFVSKWEEEVKNKIATDKENQEKEVASLILQLSGDEDKSQKAIEGLLKIKDVRTLIEKFASDPNDLVRIRVIKTLGMLGEMASGDTILNALSEQNLKVRDSSVKAIASILKINVTEIPLTLKKWTEWEDEIYKFKYKWLSNEKDKLEKDRLGEVKKITTGLQLNSTDDIKQSEKLILLLSDPYIEVRQEVFNTIKRLSEKDFGYTPDASDEKNKESIDKIKKWLEDEKKRIAETEQKIDLALKDLKKEVSKRVYFAIWTEDDIKAVKDLLKFLENPYFKVRQEAFNEISRFSKDIKAIEYKPDGKMEERKSGIEKIQEWLTKEEKRLEKEKTEGLAREKTLEPAFNLAKLEHISDFDILEKLILGLDDPYYPIRIKASNQLQKLANDKEKRYIPESEGEEREKGIVLWKKWFAEHKLDYLKDKKEAINKLLNDKEVVLKYEKLSNLTEIIKVSALIEGLKDCELDENLRKELLMALVRITKDDFGYKPEINPKDQADAIGKWSGWLNGEEKKIRTWQEEKEKETKRWEEIFDRTLDLARIGKICSQAEAQIVVDLANALNDSSLLIRKTAYEALSNYVEKYSIKEKIVGYNPEDNEKDRKQAYELWKNWSQSQLKLIEAEEKEILSKVDELAKTIGDKVDNKAKVEAARTLVGYLSSPVFSVRAKALDVLTKLEGGTRGYNVRTTQTLNSEYIPSWYWWVKQQEKLVQAKEESQRKEENK